MSQWVNGSVDGSMGRMGPGSMGQWVMGLGYDGSDGSWVTNGDPWSTLSQTPCRSQLYQTAYNSPNKLLADLNSVKHLTILLTNSLQISTQSNTIQFS